MRNAAIGFEKSLRRTGSEADDHPGSDDVELTQQEWRASFNFIRLGQAIFGRAALHHVADVNVGTLEAHGFDHLREQFSGAPDERQALRVFVAAWPFADKHKLSLGITIAEDEFISR